MTTYAQAQLDKYRYLISLSHSAEAATTYQQQVEYWSRIVDAEKINPLRVHGHQAASWPFPTVTKGE